MVLPTPPLLLPMVIIFMTFSVYESGPLNGPINKSVGLSETACQRAILLKSKVFLLRGQISVGWPDALRKTGQNVVVGLTFRHKFYRGNPVIRTLVLLVLVGCASASSKKIKGPDGTDHYSIVCNEIIRCYQKANDVCGKYKIVNSIHNVNHMGMAMSQGESHLLVKCEDK